MGRCLEEERRPILSLAFSSVFSCGRAGQGAAGWGGGTWLGCDPAASWPSPPHVPDQVEIVAPGGAGSSGARERTRELGRRESIASSGAPGDVADFAQSLSRASVTWAGAEAGTQVPRLFSYEGTATRDPSFEAGGSSRSHIWASPIFISLSSLFASLAFRFGVSSSPPFSPCRALEGRALLPAHKGGGWRGAEWERGLWRGGFNPALVGGPAEPVAEI